MGEQGGHVTGLGVFDQDDSWQASVSQSAYFDPARSAQSQIKEILFSQSLRMESEGPQHGRPALQISSQHHPGKLGAAKTVIRQLFQGQIRRWALLHVINAFATGARLTLGQVRVDGKSTEITAMPALLELLDIEGSTVIVDAMHTQWATAETITAKGSAYVMALKGNQETPHDDVWLHKADPENAERMIQ